jgi:hypothetical protein
MWLATVRRTFSLRHPGVGSLLMPVAMGVMACAILVRRHRRRVADARRARAGLASDPRDPVQGLDEASELQVSPLDVDALSLRDAEAAQDLAALETELDETELDDDAAIAMRSVGTTARERDAGDLYGAHTPAAVDRLHPDDDRAFAEGQNWIEALETSAIENGAEPERELDDIIDDEDVLHPPHASDTRDRPVADHGSGGRRGL